MTLHPLYNEYKLLEFLDANYDSVLKILEKTVGLSLTYHVIPILAQQELQLQTQNLLKVLLLKRKRLELHSIMMQLLTALWS